MGALAAFLNRMTGAVPRRQEVGSVSEKGEKATVGQASLIMANAVLGAGVLGYPFCFKVCGVGLATLLVLVTLSASELSMRLLVAASQIAGKRSYEELAAHCFGRMGRSAVDLSVGAMNLGSLVAYLNILADMFSLVANTVIPPGAEPSRNMLLSAITLGAVLPVSLFVRSPRLLSSVSQASVAFIFFFSLMIAVMALSPAWQLPGGHVAVWEPAGLLVAFPVVTYGFTAHQVLFSIYSSLASASVTRMISVIQQSMVLSTLVYLVVGAGGYIAFGPRTAGDVLRNFGGTSSAGFRLAFERTLKIGYGISILGTVPLIVLPLLPAFASGLGLKIEPGSAYANPVHEHLVTVIVIGCALTLAVLVPNIEYIFGLMGATVSVVISFILPAAIYLRVTSMQQQGYAPRPTAPTAVASSLPAARPAPWRQRRRTAAALLAFGLLAGLACTTRLLAAVAEENEVVQLAHELLREETKVLKAVEAEAKIKRVVEAVGAVAEAQRQLNAAQEETAATLGAALQATKELHATGAAHPHKNKGAVQKLQEVKGAVDAAVHKLETTTASLAATTIRLRNDTIAAAAAGNGTAAVGVLGTVGAGGGLLQAQLGDAGAGGDGQQQEQGQQQGGDAAGGEGGGGVEGAAERATMQEPGVGTQQQQQGGAAAAAVASEDVASVLDEVVVASNTTLSSVRQSQKALAAVHKVGAGALHKKKKEIMSVLQHVVNVTTVAAAQVNATVERLKQVEADKASELVDVATELLREHDAEEARRQRAEELEQLEGLREGRKVAPGGGKGEEEGAGGGAAGEAAEGGGATAGGGGQEEGSQAVETQRARETLKLATSGAASNGSASINVTEVAQAVADIAATASQVAKANLEQAIESNTAEVASRAIEIAKELVRESEVQGLRKAEGGGGGLAEGQGGDAGAAGSQGEAQAAADAAQH